jgi:hypothetical protein
MHTSHFQHTPDTVDDDGATDHCTADQFPFSDFDTDDDEDPTPVD